MEDQAIWDGFAQLEPSTKYDALYEADLCRERADWIVGMNATRLFSCLYHQTLNVGRVMTPTLAMVVMRDAEIGADASDGKADNGTELSVDGMCDSRKVSDHHAIIPTGTICAADLAALPSGERAILQLIAVRLLCVAAPNHRYAEDIKDLQNRQNEIWEIAKEILARLATIQ